MRELFGLLLIVIAIYAVAILAGKTNINLDWTIDGQHHTLFLGTPK